MPSLNRTSLHLGAAVVGALCLIAVWLRHFDALPQPVGQAFGIAFVLSVWALFATRKADEYVAALWRKGATFAFMTLLVATLFAPFIEGFLDGLLGFNRQQDFPGDIAPDLAFTGFFVAHFWGRIRGTL